VRADFSKVLTERPRHPGYGGLKYRHVRFKRKLGDDDEADERHDPPTREGMRKPYKAAGGEKELSDHLSPLIRFLRTNCGRPWNKVQAEISKHVKLDSTQQRHIREHVDGYVAVNTFIEKQTKKVWISDKHAFRSFRSSSGASGAEYPVDGSLWLFYVHPKTGVLTENKKTVWGKTLGRPPPARVTQIAVDAKTEFQLLDGIWYRVDFRPFPKQPKLGQRNVYGTLLVEMWLTKPNPSSEWVYDKIERRYVNVSRQVRPERYAAKKTQLGWKDLKKHGLQNGAVA